MQIYQKLVLHVQVKEAFRILLQDGEQTFFQVQTL